MKYTTSDEIIKELKVKMLMDDVQNKELAKRMGKSQGTINNILNYHQHNISFNYLRDMCDALGYDLDIEIKKRQ